MQGSKPKPIVQRSGLLKMSVIGELFALQPETILKKWHEGDMIFRKLKLKSRGKEYVGTERNVYQVLDEYIESLEEAVPAWRNRNANNHLQRS